MIKWVNDIFIDGKKICGILTEAVSDLESGRVQAIIVGIGINVTTEDFPQELRNIAGCIGDNIDRCKLIADIFIRLKRFSEQLSDRSFMDAYRKHSLVIGRNITFSRNGVDYTANAVTIHDDGGLEVITEKGEVMILNSGEISIKL
jgi:BirA family biotin operon repressor/biotin-[acetyl-CoA-carboxylase] ligase